MPKKKGELSIEERLEQSIVAKEEEPYKLPSNWVWTRLGDIIEYTENLDIQKKMTSDTLINYVDIEGIDNINYKIKNVKLKKVSELSSRARRVLKKGYILYSSVRPYLNNLALIEDQKENYIGSTGFFVFKSIAGENKYIFNFLLSSYIRKYYLDSLKGFNSPSISNTSFENTFIPLPPLEEQKRIVEKLDSLFEKIQKIKEIIEEVKEKTTSRREAILSKAFSGELTEKWRGENHTENARELLVKINDEKLKLWEDECKKAEDEGRKKPAKPKLKTIDEMLVGAEEMPYKLPNNWVWTRLGDITDINMGQSPKGESVSKDFSENSFGLIGGPSDMGKDFPMISRYTTSPTKFSEKEEIILSVRATLGKTVFSDGIYCLGRGVCSLKSKVIDKNILRFYLTNITEYLYLIGTGSTFLQISRNDIENLLFPLPPLEEQKEIVRVLDKVFEEENRISELISLENKIEILEKTILDRAFRGELGTGNSDDEPAIELLKKCLEER